MRRTVLAVAVVVAVVVASCGGDDDAADPTTESDGATTTVETTAGEPESGDPYRILVTGTIESAALNFPETEDGAKAAETAINAAGGIQGRPVEVVLCNDQLDPNLAVQCVRDGASDGVIAVATGIEQFAPQIVPVMEEFDLAFVGATANSAATLQSPISFPVDSGTAAWVANGQLAFRNGCTKAAVIALNSPPAEGVVDAFSAGLAAEGGETVSKQLLDPAVPDYAAVIASALADDAECLAIGISPAEMVKAIGAVRQSAQPDLPLYGHLGSFPPVIVEQLGELANGMIVTSGTYLPGDMEAFAAEMDAYNADAALSSFALNAWIGVHVIAQVADTITGEIDATSFLDAMSSASDVALPGYPMESVDFSAAPAIPELPRMFVRTAVFYELRDGGYELYGDPIDADEGAIEAVLNPS